MNIDDSREETRSLIGRPSAGPRVLHLEARYLAMVTGVLLGLYCGRHLVSGQAAPPLITPRDATEVWPDAAQPPEARPPPEVRPLPKDAEPTWPEVRARIIEAQVQMEANGKNAKALPRYAGPRIPGYLYVGPGHVLRDLSNAKQPGNVTEVQCSTYCTANPACKGFAWFRTTKWSGVSECYLKGSCPSDALRAMPGAFSWESPRPCDSSKRYQAQSRADARDDVERDAGRG